MPRARRAYGTFTVTQRHHAYTKAKLFAEVGKKTDVLPALLHRRRRARRGRRRARRARLRPQVLHRGRQLGPGRQQHAGLLRPRSLQVPATSSTPRSAIRGPTCATPRRCGTSGRCRPESLHQVTILFSDRGLPTSYRHMHGFGSHTYSFINAAGRALLGEVPLQDAAGHREPDRRRGGRASSATTARATSATCSRPSSAATSRSGASRCRSCRSRRPRRRRTTRST